jgi:cytochrome c oxidase subunit III
VELEDAYAELETRDGAMRLGMWVFLGSETLLFAGLFGLYVGYRGMYQPAFAQATAYNEEWIGSVNTFVLIVSSFFAAWAVHMMRARRPRASLWSLVLVIALGFVFLGLKSFEYAHHLHDGIAPGRHYSFALLPERGARIFFTLYYFMTGLHALHVIAGLTVMAWLISRIRREKATPEHHVELELGALYWHLVDIVWIVLWPLLYLIE